MNSRPIKRLSILGATGSIGTSCLNVVRQHPDRFQIKALTCAKHIDKLMELILEFRPEMVSVLDENIALNLEKKIRRRIVKSFRPLVLFGDEGSVQAASWPYLDVVLLAMVGTAGLKPAMAAINAGKQIALANKEILVMAGEIVMAQAREKGIDVLPVDSEHSAIFQCIKGNRVEDLHTIFLTGSGGPLRTIPYDALKNVKPEQALKHPNWNMGNKISIDSASFMNKGLELVEMVHLFNVSQDNIQILIHPESIVHSMVGFKDGAVIAQMGVPDMKEAIAYALCHPERIELSIRFPDFVGMGSLNFFLPDIKKFPSIEFAYEACRQKGTLPAVMNAANEVAVQAFLEHKIEFLSIFDVISNTMGLHKKVDNPSLSDIIEADHWARDRAISQIYKEKLSTLHSNI